MRGTEKYDFPPRRSSTKWIRSTSTWRPRRRRRAACAKVAVGFPPPSLKHIRKLQPLFCELLASKLPEWQSEDVLGQLQSDMGPNKARKGKPSLSLKPRKANTSFSESASMAPASSAYPAENRSMLKHGHIEVRPSARAEPVRTQVALHTYTHSFIFQS